MEISRQLIILFFETLSWKLTYPFFIKMLWFFESWGSKKEKNTLLAKKVEKKHIVVNSFLRQKKIMPLAFFLRHFLIFTHTNCWLVESWGESKKKIRLKIILLYFLFFWRAHLFFGEFLFKKTGAKKMNTKKMGGEKMLTEKYEYKNKKQYTKLSHIHNFTGLSCYKGYPKKCTRIYDNSHFLPK